MIGFRNRLRKRREEKQKEISLVADLRCMIAELDAILEDLRERKQAEDGAVSEAQQKREWFGEDV